MNFQFKNSQRFILSNELLVQTFSEFLMDLNCVSQNVSISRLHDNQKSGNICVFFFCTIILCYTL